MERGKYELPEIATRDGAAWCTGGSGEGMGIGVSRMFERSRGWTGLSTAKGREADVGRDEGTAAVIRVESSRGRPL